MRLSFFANTYFLSFFHKYVSDGAVFYLGGLFMYLHICSFFSTIPDKIFNSVKKKLFPSVQLRLWIYGICSLKQMKTWNCWAPRGKGDELYWSNSVSFDGLRCKPSAVIRWGEGLQVAHSLYFTVRKLPLHVILSVFSGTENLRDAHERSCLYFISAA
jgi:hypothetical protein